MIALSHLISIALVLTMLHHGVSLQTMSKAFPKIQIKAAGFQAVNAVYTQKPQTVIPAGFDRTCRSMNWDTEQMWKQLTEKGRSWYEADNQSYVYWNKGDGKWWIDGPSGAGGYIVKSNGELPPRSGWVALSSDYNPVPIVDILDGEL